MVLPGRSTNIGFVAGMCYATAESSQMAFSTMSDRLPASSASLPTSSASLVVEVDGL